MSTEFPLLDRVAYEIDQEIKQRQVSLDHRITIVTTPNQHSIFAKLPEDSKERIRMRFRALIQLEYDRVTRPERLRKNV
jgi:hypothetical protein